MDKVRAIVLRLLARHRPHALVEIEFRALQAATSSRLCAVRIKSRTSGPNGRPPAAHAYRAIAVRDR
jgi:hypothetical protein